ncbi:MAG: NB-ARC domain-containing protein/TIR domain-containing protein [Candidatus Methanomarinus sp.]|nr:MAG: NB-ARC domain-containing protein/TIR domain-containing protein [ANME-2 cluster archaeon]
MSGTTNQKLTCQECNSENVKFSEKRQAYVCVDCLHEFTIISSGNPRIFISYARDDGEEFTKKLRRYLVEEHGFSVWQDRTEMQVGEDWWPQIESTLRNEHVEYLVLVMTHAAMTSKMVQKEWRLARQEGVCVLPVIASPDLDIDSFLPWMRATHFADLSVPEEKKRFIRILEGPCQTQRVPFMVEDLPRDLVPRKDEFKQIVSSLLDTQREETVAITVALRGAGGYGKTTLAQIICHDEHIQEDFYDGILWVTLGKKPGDLTTYVEDFIRILSGKPSGLVNLQAATARLIELLADRHILMVIDDVWNSAHLRPFLQGGPLCARLVTTRNLDTVPANARKVDVDAMQKHEATALMGAGLPSGHETDTNRLAARLGKWPLLLKLVNGALRHRVHNTGQELADALMYVNTALDKRGLTFFDARGAAAWNQAVEKTLGVSIELLKPDECVMYGELAVFPEDVDIPLTTLEQLWSRTGGLDEFDTEDLCDRLMRLSLLLNFDPTTRHIRLHDVIRQYLIQKREDHLPQLHNQFLEAYSSDIPRWSKLPAQEAYLWNNLAYHLIEAERDDELRQLLLSPSFPGMTHFDARH